MNITHLCLGGGGIKSNAYIGALKALEEYNIIKNLKCISASSSGAMMGLFIVLGYTFKELNELCIEFDFNYLKKEVEKLDTLIECFTKTFGIDNGENIIKFFKIIIKKKGFDENINFLNLFKKTNIEFIITGSCLTTHSVDYFNYKNFPDMLIIDAIRITMSIPFIYNLCSFKDKKYVDGGMLDNFPIHLFRNIPKNNVLGLSTSTSIKNKKIIDFPSYIFNIIESIKKNFKKYQINGFEDRIIYYYLDIGITDFSCLNRELKCHIIKYGYQQTVDFINKNNKKIQLKKNITILKDNVPKID